MSPKISPETIRDRQRTCRRRWKEATPLRGRSHHRAFRRETHIETSLSSAMRALPEVGFY
ncbi:hypothetical protein TIFTF001_001650 [Ficus carica]|uniref:Uncharacterized protein n=1 Tax=Ficus carica TaxID=3494 RepID=A0AA87Z2L7_FICCA|nr:hypothetical protein TIFTF001_001650 [Ficus carica]